MITTTAILTIRELANYAIYNRVDVAVVSPDRYHKRMMALAFGVLVDDMLPECGEYSSMTSCLTFESGSRVWFYETPEPLKKGHFHSVVFEKMHETGRDHFELAEQRCRIPTGLGVRFLGR